jgi:signal transduction histidine kinase
VVDFRYRLTNTLNATLSGHPVEAMNGQVVSSLFPGWQGIALFAAMKTVVETGEPVAFAEEYDNFGIRGWFDYRLVKQDNGVLLTFLDVTKLKQAEQQQLQQADLLQTVVNNTPTGIVLYAAMRDANGTITDFTHRLSNPVNARVTGRSPDDLVGLPLLEHYPTNRENGHFDALVQVTETGQPQRRLIEYRAHGIDGWFDAYYVRQADGVLFTYLDVSESQQYRRQLEAANLELTRSNENLQQFAYVASHDLQEPLRKIQAFGDLLIDRQGAELGDQGVDMLRRMQSAASRMSGLIRDLLAYSRLTTQREPFQPVPLPTLLDRLLEDLDLSIRESGATITIGPLPTVAGDPAQLHQLFLNLISNALKFRRADEAGAFVKPVVTVNSLPVNVIDLPADVFIPGLADASADRWFHQISVTDNGIGFDEKYLDRVFQVFQRLHGKQQYAGSGVGLAICKRVVENHGGAITATSQPNQGSTFVVYLKSE